MGITYKNKIPYLEEQNLVEITNLIETPFYVYSQKNIIDTFLKLKKELNKDIYFSINVVLDINSFNYCFHYPISITNQIKIILDVPYRN